jgi:uncharacterized protein (TIGR02145 family)
MATYGTHPKDFDPEQVKPVLNNLAIIIKWYLKYKDFRIVSNTEPKEEKIEAGTREYLVHKPRGNRKGLIFSLIVIFVVAGILIIAKVLSTAREKEEAIKYMPIDSYRTVKIGDQVWMAENLRTTLFNDGTPIPLVTDDKEWEALTSPAYCWYENKPGRYKEVYGALYNWFAVNTGKLCPAGWHVPSDTEWTTLTRFLGDTLKWTENGDSIILVPGVAGIKLKESGNMHWAFNDSIYASDNYGFTALPGGCRNKYGPFYDIGYKGRWWSSIEDEYNEGDAKNIEMYFDQNGVTDIQQYKQFGMSVRCIKD